MVQIYLKIAMALNSNTNQAVLCLSVFTSQVQMIEVIGGNGQIGRIGDPGACLSSCRHDLDTTFRGIYIYPCQLFLTPYLVTDNCFVKAAQEFSYLSCKCCNT